jgi:hypothetical protein
MRSTERIYLHNDAAQARGPMLVGNQLPPATAQHPKDKPADAMATDGQESVSQATIALAEAFNQFFTAADVWQVNPTSVIFATCYRQARHHAHCKNVELWEMPFRKRANRTHRLYPQLCEGNAMAAPHRTTRLLRLHGLGVGSFNCEGGNLI